MSDNPMCEACLLREDAVACWHSDCSVFSVVEYCGIPAICLELKCWEVKKCDFGKNLQECPKLPQWRKENLGVCEFCGAICGHHWDGCPKNERVIP
jgi:hypothetical protein